MVIALRPGAGAELSEADLWLGPELIAARQPLLVEYVRKEWQAEKIILEQVAKSDSDEARQKRQKLEAKWENIREVMRCQFGVEIL